ncbi:MULTISPECIES: sensor histidine kinase [unclassified Sphingomonas]|uniref:sensor histidine kinase n=1 Tax=unclassified Sphingomonas TaxID=196159 RepID=UPI0006FCB32B|nr:MULTISPECIES: HAMP domain-containing sensor histidine kinase [unclassified Sphingomonas]KQX26238.1 histidine kinase [Sphingomonas sp. Root1294]KQY69307.1 histidine kinase [Sphingomonas sp. Root50]KRB89565.1 histidine kinase [Sphingomonas sp. Root720]
MRPLLLPARTALLLAFFSVLALALSVAGLAMVDRDARRIAAAEAAQRDFEALDEKLPGVIGDPSALPLLASAVGEIGQYAGRTGQPRIALFRGADGRVRGTWRRWAGEVRPWRETYVSARTPDGGEVIGIQRPLPNGAALLIARPVASASALRRSLGLWGGGIVLLLMGLSVATALIVGGQTAARIRRLNRVCDRVGEGDVKARIADPGPPDEIGVLARHMNGMLGELERRIHGLRAASDHIAHDLRTPLARVRARLSTMEDAADPETAAQAIRAAAELDRLMAAFNALLELREIESDISSPPGPFDIAGAVEDAIDLYEAVAEDEKQVRIVRAAAAGRFVGDRELVIRALANLIENALKVSPPGAMITVSARPARKDGEPALELRVTDEGPGFSRQEEQTDARSTLGGHGLGLIIVRAIAERHRGEVHVENGGRGASVTLLLRTPRLLAAYE